MTIKRVTSRPPRLSATVGPRAINRPHDVALIQALLGETTLRGRRFLPNHVTGRFDQRTEAALAGFWRATGDRRPRPRLATGDPSFQYLATAMDLAVVEGTASPYELQRGRFQPGIMIRAGVGLTDDERSKLTEIGTSLAREFSLRFNLEVFRAPSDRDIVVCAFMPAGCTVYSGNRWCRNVTSVEALRAADPTLHAILANAIEVRTRTAFAIKGAADLAVNARFKDKLTAVIRPKVAVSLRRAELLLEDGRALGLDLAVRLFEHYLSASGTPIIISSEVALDFRLIREAVAANLERFKERNFLSPDPSNPAHAAIAKVVAGGEGTEAHFTDTWKYDFNTEPEGRERYRDSAIAGVGDAQDTLSFFFGPGNSHITSEGAFVLTRRGDEIIIHGTISDLWTDEGYNFDFGKFFAEHAQRLEKEGYAKPFKWEARWDQEVEGRLKIDAAAIGYDSSHAALAPVRCQAVVAAVAALTKRRNRAPRRGLGIRGKTAPSGPRSAARRAEYLSVGWLGASIATRASPRFRSCTLRRSNRNAASR